MSEYIEITTEEGDDSDSLFILTNLNLTDGAVEAYDSPQAMELGSPLAQALSAVDGLRSMHLEGDEISVRRDPTFDWHGIVEDISSILKDFFL